ncbi:MAG TPA: hypothetical protein VNK46_03550 [Nitrospiraceae bacterium]|jgi:hypothetical protein|nr:hypothetical protein [Nitrospiraceae bacterium]
MARKLSVILGASLLVLIMGPAISFAGKSTDKHDCRQERPRGPYVCERGPLAGRTFATKKAMIEALRNGATASMPVQKESAVKSPPAKVSKKK